MAEPVEAALSPLVYEATHAGGTTAKSGGAVYWVPNSSMMCARGLVDETGRLPAYCRTPCARPEASAASSPDPRRVGLALRPTNALVAGLVASSTAAYRERPMWPIAPLNKEISLTSNRRQRRERQGLFTTDFTRGFRIRHPIVCGGMTGVGVAVPTSVLIAAAGRKVSIPIIASGGLATGSGLVAALALDEITSCAEVVDSTMDHRGAPRLSRRPATAGSPT